jgi:hypothetical protein
MVGYTKQRFEIWDQEHKGRQLRDVGEIRGFGANHEQVRNCREKGRTQSKPKQQK